MKNIYPLNVSYFYYELMKKNDINNQSAASSGTQRKFTAK